VKQKLWLAYCNSILASLPKGLFSQLQRIQNAAAILVLGLQPCDHIKPALFELHWLPVHLRSVCWCILLLSSAVPDTSVTLFRPLLHHLAYKDYVPLQMHFHIQFHWPTPSLKNGRFQWLVHRFGTLCQQTFGTLQTSLLSSVISRLTFLVALGLYWTL